MEASVKAYGKILVVGGYSILEPGNVGLVVNVNKGTTTSVQETQTGRIVIDLSNFQISVYGYVQGHKLQLKHNPEELKFIKSAVENTFKYLNYKSVRLRDIRLMSYNDAELTHEKLKTGLGSSATATVSTVASILRLHDIEDIDLVYKIARYSHHEAQGSGSGFDVSASCYGSEFFVSQGELGDMDFIDYINSDIKLVKEEYEWPYFLLPVVAFTGQSASTKKFVEHVMKYKNKHPTEYAEFMKDYNDLNMEVRKYMHGSDPKKIKFYLELSWKTRKKLGELAGVEIEPEKYTKLINEINENGALTCGLTGAGGGDSLLALCTSTEDKNYMITFMKSKGLTVLDGLEIGRIPYEIVR